MSVPNRQRIITDILIERDRQLAKWGEQRLPNGTFGHSGHAYMARSARYECDRAAAEGRLTWMHILEEEFREAAAETDAARLREELVQVAAVCMAWIEDLDSRGDVTKVGT